MNSNDNLHGFLNYLRIDGYLIFRLILDVIHMKLMQGKLSDIFMQVINDLKKVLETTYKTTYFH